MKKIIFLCLICILATFLIANEQVVISGTNEAEFIYKDATDSLKTYFDDKLSMDISYGDFQFGMKFLAQLPAYNKFENIENMSSDDVQYRWDERYAQFQKDGFFIRAGHYEAIIGRGIILNAYEDEDVDNDTRLQGLLAKYDTDRLALTALYGVLPIEVNATIKNNTVAGTDAEYTVHDFVKLGASYVAFTNFQERINNADKYMQHHVYGGRANVEWNWLSWYTEFAHSREYDTYGGKDRHGDALYSDATVYMGNLSLYSAYKNYLRFDYGEFSGKSQDYFMHELPTANYSDEPIFEDYLAGTDEEGLSGELTYTTETRQHEFIAAYSEAWTRDQKVRLMDLHLEASFNMDEYILHPQVSVLEGKNAREKYWFKNIKPALSFDFAYKEMPLYLKAEWEYENKKTALHSKITHEPMLQVDFGFPKFNLSVLAETVIEEPADLGKEAIWLGAEISADLFDHTEMVLFVGREKGGKICRNGTCKIQPQFEGVRLELITSW